MLSVDIEKCTGCRRCETACSSFHFGGVARRLARIKVVKAEAIGIDFPLFCVSCVEKSCVEGCPHSALDVHPSGTISLDAALCDACAVCAVCCPIGAVEMADGIPIFCDLCGGKEIPSCIAACNVGALSAEGTADTISLSDFLKNRKGRNEEFKRLRYAMERSRGLRERWERQCSAMREES